MSASHPIPSRAVRRTTAAVLQPAALFSWHARFASVEALSGQTGTLTRASSSSSYDSNDASYPVGYAAPRWYSYGLWNPSADPRVLGLLCDSAGDTVGWASDFLPQTMTVLLEGINTSGAAPVNGGGIMHIGNDAATGNGLAIVGTATTYQVTLTTGGGSVSSTLPSAVGNVRYRVVAQVEDSGTTQRVRLGASLNEAAFAWGTWSSTVSRAASFASASNVRLNRVGSSGTLGGNWFRRLSIYPGLLTLDEATARL